MEVTDATSANLSNYEVLQLLHNLKDNDNRKQFGSLATIKYKVVYRFWYNLLMLIFKFFSFFVQTVKYLESSPCSSQSDEIISTFLKAVSNFNLTKAEKLMLLNLRPSTEVEIQLVSYTLGPIFYPKI